MSEVSFGTVALMNPGDLIERGSVTLEAHRIAFGARVWTIWEDGFPTVPNIFDPGDAVERFRAALDSACGESTT
jgi:hypothetical protein